MTDALGQALHLLVTAALAAPVLIRGQRVPAWWTWDNVGGGVHGHVNLGLAHGVGVIFRVKSSIQLLDAA